ncbi:MAG: tetratricopeptide repeat protein [Lachnospiraceae bacterium]|nr:tetratricopeptide repeat protein [Lachnospiraceae bacterium]MEE1341474.1 tetratricopeptide repeat protein [Lachnospiraceae bacterium]
MNCIKCGKPVLMNDYCSQCGLKQDYIKKAYNTSNWYYNHGLDKAMVRDLTGAMEDLKTALKYNKKNTQARNLLGLIYCEMGEVVSALGEWVISKHFQSEDNIADKYIRDIQNNPSRLETVNQIIKKYNQTLSYAMQGSEDLALIQLKKVLNLSPNFVNGHLLLALLYMQNNEHEKAKKALKKVLKIDRNNTLAIKYMKELGEREIYGVRENVKREDTRDNKKADKRESLRRDVIVPSPTYEDNSSSRKHGFVYLIVGILIGAVAAFCLFIPNMQNNAGSKYDKLKAEYNDEVSRKNQTISSLEEDNKALNTQVDQLQKELAQYTGDTGTGNMYENLLMACKLYLEDDKVEAAKKIAEVDVDNIDIAVARELYEKISEDCNGAAASSLYQEGYELYSAYKYEESIPVLLNAYEIDPTNVDALYFLARAYHRVNDLEKAKETYQKVIDQFPDSQRATKAKGYLGGIS